MSNERSVIDQKQVAFYDEQITAVRIKDGTVFVPIRPICERLGVAWQPQARKLNSDPILSEVSMSVTIRLQTSADSSRRPKTSKMLALPLDYLNGWLFGINANRVKESVREGLLIYQREAYRVLFEAFTENQVTHRPTADNIEVWLQTNSDPTAVAYRHAMAIANLAREQALMKAAVEQRFASAETRLDAIEAELGNADRFITVSQAAQLSDAVRGVGLVFSKTTGHNEYGGVYGELHRRFNINSYKRLPAGKFEEAMNWLRQWYQDLMDGDAAPF